MSQPDPAPQTTESSKTVTSAPSSAARTRKYALFALLLLMLGALWYDRNVARRGVESAFDRVERMNEEANLQVGLKPLTNKDVQAALNTTPSEVLQEGGYQIEKYSWRAGLPIITRDYFTVFSSAPPNRFLKHFKFELPKEELTGEASFFAPSTAPADAKYDPAPVTVQ